MGAEQSYLKSVGNSENNTSVQLTLNGQPWRVNPDSTESDTSLADFIRDIAGFKGTKLMCREGGCGACIVSVKLIHPGSQEAVIRSVNSCLVPVLACDGWDITTIEMIGSKKDGLHRIQERLVVYGGTQCGFCTPGLIMNMYSLTSSKQSLTAQEVEDALDANICRCTGYRPILDAFQSLIPPSINHDQQNCPEIEEANQCPRMCISAAGQQRVLQKAVIWEGPQNKNECRIVNLPSSVQWIYVRTIEALFQAIYRIQAARQNYRLIAGNTAKGVFPSNETYDAFIDITKISDLCSKTITPETLTLGGGSTLSDTIEVLKEHSQTLGFNYLKKFSEHLERVATLAVRNVATLAGNLMLKKTHPEFPSDVFVLLETVGAKLNIASGPNVITQYLVSDLLSLNMAGKVILSIEFPKLVDYYFHSFKITRRYQNSHAYVNAGFLLKLLNKTSVVSEKPAIVYGGISSTFIRASNAEMFLIGRPINDIRIINECMRVLDEEIVPQVKPPDASAAYKKLVAKSLFYKVILKIFGNKISPKVQSGSSILSHGVTRGTQKYDSDQRQWPLYQPVAKLEAVAQCTGEAEYINDIQPEFGELFGVFVLSTVAKASLKTVDASEALRIPGVVSFLQAKDIPGVNNYMPYSYQVEPIFTSGSVNYAGQPIGLIVAKNRSVAVQAATKVQITYENVQKPVLTFEQALSRTIPESQGIVTGPGDLFSSFQKFDEANDETTSDEKPTKTISGEFRNGSQYHFHMETQTCICIPREDSMDVHCSTQWMEHVQAALTSALVLPSNYFNMEVKRLGGGYGAKLTRCAQVACACAVAAHTLNKPVRIVLDLEANMEMIGGRLPCLTKYEVGFTDEGKIVSLKGNVLSDSGWSSNEVTSSGSVYMMQSCYQASGWKIKSGNVNTDTASKTFCRAPGSTEGIAAMEYIMDHIAFTLKKDPLVVRQANFIKKDDLLYGYIGKKFTGVNLIPAMIDEMNDSAELDSRKEFIGNFNKMNRWKKRGISVVPMRYPVHTSSINFKVFIAVYHVDGSVVVTHSGIEMGQGINTKVAQVVAHELRISLEKVKVKATNNIIGANCTMTGGAITSEYCSYAALKACKDLNTRMQPDVIPTYDVWGLTATEVEIDCLTGEYKVIRVDLIEDAGKSISPDIDVGQVTGALIMGFGLWLTEKYQFDETTGRNLTNRTWEYKVPMAKDIPEILNITLKKDADNPLGILRSKATGEPPICMSCSVLLALKSAIGAARLDVGNFEWFQLDGPVTPEDILLHCLTSSTQFQF
ncbi:unnamed protein product [Allacma fusca]|uniref:Uncharacterized protein n=1 Tax=Allacma fusca TaxID=39272 RepID=A0A8J2L1K9_9HEXA|nr:unnamed protein product [Allacma fusca]